MANETETKSNFAKKLKELFSIATANETKKTETFLDQKLSNGTTITTNGPAFTVGAKIQTKTDDGTVSEVPDGTYTLSSDNSEIVVKGGIIESITPASQKAAAPASPAASAANAPATPAPADLATQPNPAVTIENDGDTPLNMDMITKILSDFNDRIAALENAAGDTQKMKSELEAFKAAPGGSSISKITTSAPAKNPGEFLAQLRKESNERFESMRPKPKVEGEQKFESVKNAQPKYVPRFNFGGAKLNVEADKK
jgi:hypothetical protein